MSHKKRVAKRQRRPFVPHALTADEYLMGHWSAKKLWESNDKAHHRKRFRFIASALNGGERFLDVGCAFGHSTAKLASMKPGRWEGCDFSALGVNEARCNFPALKFHYAADAPAVAALGEFDAVVMSEVLEHVEDDKALVDAALAIAPMLIVTTPSIDVGDPGHRRLYTRSSLEALFAGHAASIHEDRPFFFAAVRR